MRQPRYDEELGRLVVAAGQPGREVRWSDDGSRPGVHDFEVWVGDERFGAGEVGAAADAEAIEYWNAINGRAERWIEPGLEGGWLILCELRARVRRIQRELPDILRTAERDPAVMAGVDLATLPGWSEIVETLGITYARQAGTQYPGSIYASIDLASRAAAVFTTVAPSRLPTWLSDWIRDPSQRDNLEKLRRSGAPERHLVVIVPTLTTAPSDVVDALALPNLEVPTEPLDLPPEASHAWIVSTWEPGCALSWNTESGWS